MRRVRKLRHLLHVLRPRQRAAVAVYAELCGTALPQGHWERTSELPVGVGMSSSTADIVAAVKCAAATNGHPAGRRLLQTVMVRIERSDPVHLSQPVVYLSARQRVARWFPPMSLPLFAIYAYRGPLETATIREERLLDFYAAHRTAYAAAYEALCTALSAEDVAAVARAATHSVEKDRTTGFLIAYIWGEEMTTSMIGLASDAPFAYFNLVVYEPVRRAIELGLARVRFGPGTYAAKRQRGCVVRPLTSWMRVPDAWSETVKRLAALLDAGYRREMGALPARQSE